MQAACGVEQQHVSCLQFGSIHRATGDIHRLLACNDRKCRHINLLTQHCELFLRSRAINVERRHQGLLAVLFLDQLGELGSRGGLTGALKADHHDYDGWLGIQFKTGGTLAAQHLDQFVIDDLDHLLAGCDRAEHFLPHRTFCHRIDKAAGNRQGDIGFKQGDANFTHGIAHILLFKCAAPLKAIKHAAQAI